MKTRAISKPPVASGVAIGNAWAPGNLVRTFGFRLISPHFVWNATGLPTLISGTSSMFSLLEDKAVTQVGS